MKQHNGVDVSIRIIGASKGDPIQYEMPSTDDLAVLIIGDLTIDNFKRDIIVYNKDHVLQEISMQHPALMALQYPLLFPYGERGYQLGIYYQDNGYGGTGKTYQWNTIVYYLRARKRIVLTVASSGVASLLLPNGRTAHSRFKIPIDR